MNYRDQTKVRRTVNALDSSVTFSDLIEAAIGTIHELKLFYEVGVQIRDRDSYKYPSCRVRPIQAERLERHLSGMRFINEYTINPVIMVKHPNDSIMMQQVLFLATKIRLAFCKDSSGKGPFIYSSIPGHHDTKIVPVDVEPLEQTADDGVVFNSGLNIVFTVQEAQ